MSGGESGTPPDRRGSIRDGVVAQGVDRISHQLKNPLQTISVNLEVLRLRASRDVSAEEAGEIDRLAEVVERGVRTLDRRIGMLVDLARRSSDDGWRRVALGSYVREAAATFQLDERESGRGLQVEVPPSEEDGEARIRPGWLVAALLEVVAALPSDEEGGAVVRVTVRDGHPRLELPDPPAGAGGAADAIRRAGGEMARTGDRIHVTFPEA